MSGKPRKKSAKASAASKAEQRPAANAPKQLNEVAASFTNNEKLMIAVFCVIASFLVWLLSPVLAPFLIAAGLAYLGDPIVDRMEEWKLSRGFAVTLVYIVLAVVSLLVVVLVVPLLERQIRYLIERFPAWIEWLQGTAIPAVQARFGLAGAEFDLQALVQLVKENWSQAGGVVASVLRSVSRSGLEVLALVANLLIVPIAAFYLLRDWDKMIDRIHALIPRRMEPNVVYLARESDFMLSGFMRGQLIVMASLSLIYVVGLSLVGVKLALLIGLFAGILSFVPYLGVIVGLVSASAAIVFQTQDPMSVLWVLLVFGVGQVLESALLTPLFVGDRIGLHPVGVIFAVMAGGQLFGFVGVLLALPATAVIAVIVRHVYAGYLESGIYAHSPAEEKLIETPGDNRRRSAKAGKPKRGTH